MVNDNNEDEWNDDKAENDKNEEKCVENFNLETLRKKY